MRERCSGDGSNCSQPGLYHPVFADQIRHLSLLGIIEKASKELVEGDIFLLTYSGHGGQINDVDDQEPDGLDETWALYDRELIDDELYAMWSMFRPGVRICVWSDSCHCGIMTKEMFLSPGPYLARLEARVRASTREDLRPKFLPPEVQAKIYKERAEVLYDTLRKKTPRRETGTPECSVILISACQDKQVAMDGRKNGVFTEALLRIWDRGRFVGGYHHFRNAIADAMPPTQSPKYAIVGHRERVFEHEKPFSITLPRCRCGVSAKKGTSMASHRSLLRLERACLVCAVMLVIAPITDESENEYCVDTLFWAGFSRSPPVRAFSGAH